MRIRNQLVALSALGVVLAACADDDANLTFPATQTVLETLRANPELSAVVAALEATGLDSALNGPDPVTVFAPTNAAIAAVFTTPPDIDLLANILLTHVVAGEVDSAAVLGATQLTSLAKTSLVVDAAALTVGGATLSDTLDVKASNGIVHILDAVIIPANIPEFVAATEDLFELYSAVGAASPAVGDLLSGSGPITVFAPVNSAFDQADLDTVLGYHVVDGQILSTDFLTGQAITMANGQVLTVTVANGAVTLTDSGGNDVQVTVADVRLLNGVVHFIDTVLTPVLPAPGNIVEVASSTPAFSRLVGALEATDLDAVLQTEGPFTVFAPTDDAFAALDFNFGGVDVDVRANILLAHVLPVSKNSFEVVTTSPLATVANISLAVDASGSPIVITPVGTTAGSTLSSTLNVAASNGLIHVMDQVIVPPTIVEVAGATADLLALVQALSQASQGVQDAVSPETLEGSAPITVFAPTNAAFAASDIDLDMVSESDLDAVLAGHVAVEVLGIETVEQKGQLLTTDLMNGQEITTLNGIVTVNIDSEGAAITLTDGMGNTVNVIATLKDIRTLTGVVHVIDGVLMPSNDS